MGITLYCMYRYFFTAFKKMNKDKDNVISHLEFVVNMTNTSRSAQDLNNAKQTVIQAKNFVRIH